MKEAIQKAIEGGYLPKGHTREQYNYLEKICLEHKEIILLDPMFWKGLVKGANLSKIKITYKLKPSKFSTVVHPQEMKRKGSNVTRLKYRNQKNIWINEWHSFIDHLAEGKDIDLFFNNLLK